MLTLWSLAVPLEEHTGSIGTSACSQMADTDRVDASLRACNLETLIWAVCVIGVAIVLNTAEATQDEHLVGVGSVKIALILSRRAVDEVCQACLRLTRL